jgi:hypothetical protein
MVDAKLKNARPFTNPVWRRRQGIELSHRGDVGLGASRLRSAAAARLERGAVIVAIAVTWG